VDARADALGGGPHCSSGLIHAICGANAEITNTALRVRNCMVNLHAGTA
jgi:hypothetical protein